MGDLSAGLSRRRLGGWWMASAGLALVGCGGGDLDPLGVIDDASDEDVDPDQRDCNLDGKVDLKDDCSNDGKVDDKDKGCCLGRGDESSGSGSPRTLYDAYLALASGMSKAQVLALVPFRPSQGADTAEVLWVEADEALGVRFNGTASGATITFAQWGLSIAAGGRQESRNF